MSAVAGCTATVHLYSTVIGCSGRVQWSSAVVKCSGRVQWSSAVVDCSDISAMIGTHTRGEIFLYLSASIATTNLAEQLHMFCAFALVSSYVSQT